MAAQLWSGDPATTLDWDTSLEQTDAFRLASPQASLLRNVNGDDGDRHFAPGLISSRTDLFSQIDYSAGSFGARVSIAGWLDPVYLRSNDRNPAASFNPISVPPGTFPKAVQHLQGLQADLLDAFVHEKFVLDKMPVTLRLGRHTLIWGESLFFAGNGIASGQAPQDMIRALSVPGTPAQELFLPVAQFSGSIELHPGLSVEFYQQLEWRRDRLPGVESYFSTTDFLDAGGERILLGNGRSLLRAADQKPDPFAQDGISLRTSNGQIDWGLYALRTDAHLPTVLTDLAAGTYHLAYPGHVGIYGASLSTFLGDDALGSEISFHQGVPVGFPGGLEAPTKGPIPRADSVNGQISLISQQQPGRFWDSADIDAEIAGNIILDASAGAPSESAAGKSTIGLELQVTPHYFHVLPALDLSPSATLVYGATGKSAIDPEIRAGSGSLTLALDLAYRVVWHARAQISHFIGPPSTQPLADRDFAAVSVLRSF